MFHQFVARGGDEDGGGGGTLTRRQKFKYRHAHTYATAKTTKQNQFNEILLLLRVSALVLCRLFVHRTISSVLFLFYDQLSFISEHISTVQLCVDPLLPPVLTRWIGYFSMCSSIHRQRRRNDESDLGIKLKSKVLRGSRHLTTRLPNTHTCTQAPKIGQKASFSAPYRAMRQPSTCCFVLGFLSSSIENCVMCCRSMCVRVANGDCKILACEEDDQQLSSIASWWEKKSFL